MSKWNYTLQVSIRAGDSPEASAEISSVIDLNEKIISGRDEHAGEFFGRLASVLGKDNNLCINGLELFKRLSEDFCYFCEDEAEEKAEFTVGLYKYFTSKFKHDILAHWTVIITGIKRSPVVEDVVVFKSGYDLCDFGGGKYRGTVISVLDELSWEFRKIAVGDRFALYEDEVRNNAIFNTPLDVLDKLHEDIDDLLSMGVEAYEMWRDGEHQLPELVNLIERIKENQK